MQEGLEGGKAAEAECTTAALQWRQCPYQVHAVPVLVGSKQRDDVFVALQVVHDLHLPPHILYILLCPAPIRFTSDGTRSLSVGTDLRPCTSF